MIFNTKENNEKIRTQKIIQEEIKESMSDMSSDSSIPEEKFRNGVVGAMKKVDQLLDIIITLHDLNMVIGMVKKN